MIKRFKPETQKQQRRKVDQKAKLIPSEFLSNLIAGIPIYTQSAYLVLVGELREAMIGQFRSWLVISRTRYPDTIHLLGPNTQQGDTLWKFIYIFDPELRGTLLQLCAQEAKV